MLCSLFVTAHAWANFFSAGSPVSMAFHLRRPLSADALPAPSQDVTPMYEDILFLELWPCDETSPLDRWKL